MGCTLDEVRGQHHSLFVEAAEAETPAYQAFWRQQREGHVQSAEFMRVTKDRQHTMARIRNMVATINGLAMQTNLLSLNAATKAARADEGG